MKITTISGKQLDLYINSEAKHKAAYGSIHEEMHKQTLRFQKTTNDSCVCEKQNKNAAETIEEYQPEEKLFRENFELILSASDVIMSDSRFFLMNPAGSLRLSLGCPPFSTNVCLCLGGLIESWETADILQLHKPEYKSEFHIISASYHAGKGINQCLVWDKVNKRFDNISVNGFERVWHEMLRINGRYNICPDIETTGVQELLEAIKHRDAHVV